MKSRLCSTPPRKIWSGFEVTETVEIKRADRTPVRVRHELRFRDLEVRDVARVTPNLVRVTLGGDSLEGFVSAGFDDHMKVIFPDAVTGEIRLPNLAIARADDTSPKPTMRDYTPHHFDAKTNTLQVDFVLHEAGPATAWARQAKPGQRLGIGGPRGSFVMTTDFDWHLLIGDATALPAISRRLAELQAGTKAAVLVEVEMLEDEVELTSAAQLSVTWVHHNPSNEQVVTTLADALKALAKEGLPQGDFYAWIACESLTAKALRAQLIAEHGANPKWTKAAGYWKQGSVAVHENHED